MVRSLLCNTDASLRTNKHGVTRSFVGGVITDEASGREISRYSVVMPHASPRSFKIKIEHLEMLGILEGLIRCMRLRASEVVFRTDSMHSAAVLNECKPHRQLEISYLRRRIVDLAMDAGVEATFKWVSRKENRIADKLASTRNNNFERGFVSPRDLADISTHAAVLGVLRNGYDLHIERFREQDASGPSIGGVRIRSGVVLIPEYAHPRSILFCAGMICCAPPGQRKAITVEDAMASAGNACLGDLALQWARSACDCHGLDASVTLPKRLLLRNHRMPSQPASNPAPVQHEPELAPAL